MELDKEELEATRNRKCEYCDLVSGDEKSIKDNYGLEMYLERHNNTYELIVVGNECYIELDINYCPMCR